MDRRASRGPLRTPAARRKGRARRGPRTAKVCLLIPTHALPPLDYRLPPAVDAGIGSVVVAPLSGHPRLGVVIGVDGGEGSELEEVWQTHGELALSPEIVEVCHHLSDRAAIPLATALRAALPPGVGTDRYRILEPSRDWTWRRDDLVGRTALRRRLGQDGFRAAETSGKVVFDPLPEGPAPVEWAVVRGEVDLSRAPRQRQLFEELRTDLAGLPVTDLLARSGADRATLRALVRRGAVGLERRPKAAPIASAGGAVRKGRSPFARPVERVLERGGPWIWRTPTEEQASVVAALVRAAVQRGAQTLVLAPEIQTVERLGAALVDQLPAGTTVALHHNEMGRDRARVHAAARAGEVDVVIGTRTASLLPLAREGIFCVVDEPNEAHRAQPGFEGLPVHARDIVMERCAVEGGAALFLSPYPSLRLYGASDGIREIRPRLARQSPHVRLVDMRGTGAVLSREAVDACRGAARVGVLAGRLGYATAVVCASCGTVASCPRCGLPLVLRAEGLLGCSRCGFAGGQQRACGHCGSDRLVPTGLAVERIREDLAAALGEPIGLLTADSREDGRVAVGTAHAVLAERWDAVIVPDIDAALFASSANRAERAFRLVFAAAEAARALLLVQSRVPEDEVLLAALRGDYATFASKELPRLEALGYPPFGHVCIITVYGPETAVRGAVESGLREASEPELSVSDLVRSYPAAGSGSPSAWRLLLRSSDLGAVARAGARIARAAANGRLRARVDVDPEEV